MNTVANPFLPGRTATCRNRNFPSNLKLRMLTLSKDIRRTRWPFCMYPGCESFEPIEVLELHHIQAKSWGGYGVEENAVLFCKRHHGWAHCFVFPPEYCFAFREGRVPTRVEEMFDQPIELLWEKFAELSEFSNCKKRLNDRERLDALGEIRFVASQHPKREENALLWERVMGWTASDQAALLTSLIPGRMPYSERKCHPRNVISELVAESKRYVHYSSDDFLKTRNDHISAVNYNALLRFEDAVASIERSIREFEHLRSFSLDINRIEYLSYLYRQLTVLLAKAGNRRALTVANSAVTMSNELSASEAGEATTRQFEAAILLGEQRKADEIVPRVMDMSDDPNRTRQIIRLNHLAGYFLCKEAYSEAREFADAALNVARENGIGHQAHKALNLLRAVDNRKKWKGEWSFAVRRSAGRPATLRLASLL